MALNLPTLNFYHSSNSQELVILTHGASEGVNSPFLEKIVQKTKTEHTSLLAVQMPFKDRGESQSSGKKLKEELTTLQSALEFFNYQNFQKLHFIGKSLGGIIFSQFLKRQPANLQSKSQLTVLGYIYGDVIIPDLINRIHIIQGEYDKYGNLEQLQEEIYKSQVSNKLLSVVEGADHSYRNANKEPVFQDKAIELI